MDLLQQSFLRLSELARSMSPAARVAAVGSLACVVLGLSWLAKTPADEPGAYLMGRQAFSAAQLRDMEAAFGKAGLVDYRIEDDRVRVPSGQQSKYMAALADAGAMPEDFGEYLRRAVDSGGFMISGSRQDAQTKIALQSELQLAISRMKGVKKASVLIAEETSRGFPQTKTVTASVAIEPSSSAPVDEATIADIRSYVASAWAGLKPDAVTVVSTNRASSAAVPEPPAGQPARLWVGENWTALGIGGLILVGLTITGSAVRTAGRPAAPETPIAHSEPVPVARAESADGVAVPRAAPMRAAVTLAALREELTVAIRQNPQAAAGVLRTWVGNASETTP